MQIHPCGEGQEPSGKEGIRDARSLVLLSALACSPAAAKDTGLIFVSNEKTNNIIVIDPASYKVVKDIKVARRPRDMHFNADHSKLYVACGDDDVIDILDVAKLKWSAGSRPGQARKPSASTRNAAASTSPTRKARRLRSSTWSATPSCRRCRPAPNRRAYWSARTARSSTSPPRPAISCMRSMPTAARSCATWSSACGRGGSRRRPTARICG